MNTNPDNLLSQNEISALTALAAAAAPSEETYRDLMGAVKEQHADFALDLLRSTTASIANGVALTLANHLSAPYPLFMRVTARADGARLREARRLLEAGSGENPGGGWAQARLILDDVGTRQTLKALAEEDNFIAIPFKLAERLMAACPDSDGLRVYAYWAEGEYHGCAYASAELLSAVAEVTLAGLAKAQGWEPSAGEQAHSLRITAKFYADRGEKAATGQPA